MQDILKETQDEMCLRICLWEVLKIEGTSLKKKE
jgi:hypothetical protein